MVGGLPPVTFVVTEADAMSIEVMPSSISDPTDSSSNVTLAKNVASVDPELENGLVSSTTSSIGMLSRSVSRSQVRTKVL
ncbi:MAG: hypothetical protein OEM15_11285 [Myxococcales bacterium]|nr:hypothetical protein [Myxococcales bacterium]